MSRPLPHIGPKPRLGYVGSLIERAAEIRHDVAALTALRERADARAYVIGGEMVVLRRADTVHHPLFTLAEAQVFGTAGEMVFLGLCQNAPRFGLALERASVEALKARDEYVVTDLRSIAVSGLVESKHLPPLAEAKALLGWHTRHRFCPNCGSQSVSIEGGWRRDCPTCNTQHFPRTDPVVIMLPVLEKSRVCWAVHIVLLPGCGRVSPASSSLAKRSKRPCAEKRARRPASSAGTSVTLPHNLGRFPPLS